MTEYDQSKSTNGLVLIYYIFISQWTNGLLSSYSRYLNKIHGPFCLSPSQKKVSQQRLSDPGYEVKYFAKKDK